MGGNLLKIWHLPDKRIPDVDYQELKQRVVNTLRDDWRCDRPLSLLVDVAPSVRSKADHGDLDVIVGTYGEDVKVEWLGHSSFSNYIKMKWGYFPHRNTNVYSFPVDGFQVDVTFVPATNFRMAVAYSSWGDTGNLMGRIYHNMGLHLGHIGLSFWIRQGLFDKNVQWSDSDHIYEKVILTQDMMTILNIGGFSSRWYDGFDTEEDVFEWIIGSDYFDPAMFALESLNHTNRTRNRKRGMYMRFINYLDGRMCKTPRPLPSKTEMSLLMQLRYPHFKDAVSKYRFKHALDTAIAAKINGRLVMEWTGASGVQVGELMKYFRALDPQTILTLSVEELQEKTLELYKRLS